MLNFPYATEQDRREAAKIAYRRALDEERKKRIFNPRARLLGVDQTVLNQQVIDKKRHNEEQQRINRNYEEQIIRADQLAIALQHKEEEVRHKLQQEINKFRLNCQKAEYRREFDLNDPNMIKNQSPARIGDDDPRCGPSSAQKFEGEDYLNEERYKVQQEQTKAWLEQQMQEKEQAENDRKRAEEAYIAGVVARSERAKQLEALEQECRRKLESACHRFNKALAEEKDFERQRKQQETLEDNQAEIFNVLTSDLMTENPEVSQSNLGPSRAIAYLYKGMSKAQKEEIRKLQLAQIEEERQRKAEQERKNKEFDEYINGTHNTIHWMDQELEDKKKALSKQIKEENLRLANEQKSHQKYLEKTVYTYIPTDEFYDQFNTTAR